MLRDVLLRLALAGLYRPHWSETILVEVRRHLPDFGVPDEKADRVLALMGQHFAGAMVPVWPEERLIELTNHPGDRHVLAVAIEAEASVIVTDNIRHFGASALARHGVRAMTPDDFLLSLLHRRRDAVLEVLRGMSRRLSRPPLSPAEVAETLSLCVPRFAREAAAALRE